MLKLSRFRIFAAGIGLFLVSGGALAADPYEIYSYWSVDELWTIFNGVAAIVGSGDYSSLFKTVMLMGLFVAMFATIGAKHFGLINWIIQATMLYSLLMAPVADVIIVDKTGDQPPKPVANVPMMLAVYAHIQTKVGDWLTRATEATMSIPGDLKFQNNGLAFAHEVIAESRRMVIADPKLRYDIQEFVSNCVFPEIGGTIDAAEYAGSTDVWAYFDGKLNAGRISTYDMGASSDNCPVVYTVLSTRLNAGYNAAAEHYGLIAKPSLLSGRSMDQAKQAARDMLLSVLPTAYSTMVGAGAAAPDIIRQNMMVNLLREHGATMPAALGDPSAVQIALAQTQAEATATAAYSSQAKLAKETMPRIRNAMEMMVYAVFPIVAIFMVVAGEKGWLFIKSYFVMGASLSLWPPMYAVMNFIEVSKTSAKMRALAEASQGLSIQTAGDVGMLAISDQAMMGYMVLLVPVLAIALVKGGEMALTSAVSNWFAPLSSAGNQAGSQVATGNNTLGILRVALVANRNLE